MSSDIFKFRQFDVYQDFDGMKVGSDGVMLGAWAKGGNRILDVGTGTGLIALMMAQRFPKAELMAIDISEDAFLQAGRNIANSIFANRIEVKHTSFQNLSVTDRFDAIVTNPPFFIDSLKNPNQTRNIARHTDTLSYSDLFHSAMRLLADEGCFSAIIPSDYKDRFIQEACLCGFFISRIYGIKTVERKLVKRYLLEFKLKRSDVIDAKTFTMMTHNERSEWYENLVSDFYL
ncbi:tRNA1(Val) (adenine(37)-N6)-methyltransferase [Prevotella herbatica]|uniref:tRNA1(Val) (adenine(37)-N6)-methyltransferase n=1 Tax=Prevotella herbatica TaxID=2801997 RepID=A0ABN6EMI0_9BACT|nr:methyltransferase [Prevotella herbatica]BCS86209.1 tRNA1(Val) (adenine(37)-N6)-methyltransferase [Prevotella herbatica]